MTNLQKLLGRKCYYNQKLRQGPMSCLRIIFIFVLLLLRHQEDTTSCRSNNVSTTSTTSTIKIAEAFVANKMISLERGAVNRCSRLTGTFSSLNGDAAIVDAEITNKQTKSLSDTYEDFSQRERQRLKEALKNLGKETDRGFDITNKEQRQQAIELINELSKYNPSVEPLKPYYNNKDNRSSSGASINSVSSATATSLQGKWTLVYTDAPDITSLASTTPTAKLGRIGQDCTSLPYVKNIIEWERPDFVKSIPFLSGQRTTGKPKILQKVITKGSASPSKPFELNLELAGIELVAAPDDGVTQSDEDSNSFWNRIQRKGLPVTLLEQRPIQLQGPLTAPFGKATILYLDEELRILKTNQNHLAVNVRCQSKQEEWF